MLSTPHQGFSLIELSVVLVLVSLATAMVLPNLSAAYSSAQARSELSEMLLRVSSMGYDAFSRGEEIIIASSEDARRVLEPAPDWQIEVLTPVRILSSGVCLGGALRFTRDDWVREVALTAPYCQVERPQGEG